MTHTQPSTPATPSTASSPLSPTFPPSVPSPTTSNRVDPRAAAFSGAFSGTISSIVTHPLDVVRTKLAVERTIRGGQAPKYSGTGGTLRRVFREEGIRGLFRGITPAVISHAPAAAVFFSTYSFVKTHVRDFQQHQEPSKFQTDVLPSSLGAGAGWAMTCLLLNPLFVLKTKQQTQSIFSSSPNKPLKYTGLFSSLRVVLAEQGIKGLYAGVVAAIAGAPGAMIQMPLYEYLKRFGLNHPNDTPSHIQVAMASASSSCCVGVVMYPMEVVRLRLQAQGGISNHNQHRKRRPRSVIHNTPTPNTNLTNINVPSSNSLTNVASTSATITEYRGIIDCFKKIFVQEGFRSFYKGIGSSIIRTVPQSAIGLSCYETILRMTTYFVQWHDT